MIAAQDSRRLAFQDDKPGMDCQHYRNLSIADIVDHTTRPTILLAMWITMRPNDDDTFCFLRRHLCIDKHISHSITVISDEGSDSVNSPLTSMQATCGLLLGARHISRFTQRWYEGCWRRTSLHGKAGYGQIMRLPQKHGTIAHLPGCAVGQTQCLRGVPPISGSWILIGRRQIYLDCNVYTCILVRLSYRLNQRIQRRSWNI